MIPSRHRRIHVVLRSATLAAGFGLAWFAAVAGAAAAGAEKQEGWKAEWERAIAAARKEGRVVVYARAQDDYHKLFKEHFEPAFPGIRVEYVIERNPIPRLVAERRGQKYIPDIAMGGVSGGTLLRTLIDQKVFQPMRPALLLPEVVDEAKWFENKLWFSDRDEQFVMMFGLDVGKPVAINTQLVDAQAFTSFRELLNPKWRGKIVSHDFLRGGGTGSSIVRFLYSQPQLGPDFLRALYRDMDITLSEDQRQMADWLAKGRFAISVFPRTSEIFQAREVGLPVDILNLRRMKEGYPATAGAAHLYLLNPAPHPNAAKVFLNWLLSRAGLEAYERLTREPSLRVDTTTKGLVDEFMPKKGDPYMVVNLEKYWHLDEEITPLLKTLRR